MMTKEMLKKIILTNIPNYYVTDENCENLYYKALSNGIERVMIGPSSMKAVEEFASREVKTGVTIAYPSGTVCPELKAQEILDCEKNSPAADLYFVTVAVGYFMSGHDDNLIQEMRMCVNAVDKPVYFIIEAAEMSDEYLEKLCSIAKEEKVAGLVLSTAFMPYDIKRPGADDVKRVKRYAGGCLEIIAAGIIETEEDIKNMLDAGADAVMVNELYKIVKA